MAVETFTYDNLETGRMPSATATRTMISGYSLVRGAILGKITASGKYQEWDSGFVNGAQTPYAILAEDCDALAGDATCLIYTFGEFNEDELVYQTNETFSDTTRDSLRDAGIYTVTSIRQ